MPGFQLILTSDTINQGRIKINDAFSATTGLWSGSTGNQSLIINNGSGNIAESDYSISASFNGKITTSDAEYSGLFAGQNNIIQSTTGAIGSDWSVILGGRNNVIDSDAPDDTHSSIIVGGNSNVLSGSASSAVILGGVSNRVENSYSTILGGQSNVAGGSSSTIIGGSNNIVNTSNSIVAGQNVESRSANTFSMGFAIFGSASVNNNTIALNYTDGSLYYNGALIAGGADYAEFFEWNDSNLNNEDRVGYFASLTNDKIEIGNSNIIGVISNNYSMAGDGAELKWNDLFQKDKWGNVIKEKYEIYELLDDNNQSFEIYIDEKRNVYKKPPSYDDLLGELYSGDTSGKKLLEVGYANKINPSFDVNEIYVPRKDRPEWSPVGLLGKLYVRTDENITGSSVSANSYGMAVNGSDYHVLKEIQSYDGNYGIVQILFK